MDNLGKGWVSRTTFIGIWATLLACFCMPFSTALMNGFALIAFVLWLISGRLHNVYEIIKDNISVLLALLLFASLVVGLTYTPAPMSDALSIFKKYRELLFFVMALSLFKGNERAVHMGQWSFILGAIVLLLISYGMLFSLIPSHKLGYSTVYHITHGFFMAILAFWCLQKFFAHKSQFYIWLPFFIATTYNLLFICHSRTGMLLFVALILLTLYQRLPIQYSILTTLLVFLILFTSYQSSQHFSSRVDNAVTEITQYNSQSSRTSLGMRFDWWQNSLELIREKPVLGHGTGSFSHVQKELVKDRKTKPSDNPHNEYLLIAVQTGLLGSLLFTCWLITLFIYSYKLPKYDRCLLQGVVVAMGVGCLMNSFLLDSHQGHFFALMTGILCAKKDKNLE